MHKPVILALAAALTAAASAPQAETEHGKFRITNDAHRVVECNLLVEGRTRTYLKVHMGKAYYDTFPANGLLQLACVRGAKDFYGPLKIGVDYRFVDAPGDRVDVIEAPKG
jgi:hypothetical protein